MSVRVYITIVDGGEVDITIVDGDEDTLVPEAGLNRASSGRVGSGNQERVGL